MISLGVAVGARIPHPELDCVLGPTWAAATVLNYTHDSCAVGNGVYVITGINGSATAAQRSLDGFSWVAATTVPSSGGFALKHVAFGNGKFFAYRDAVTLLTSTDGDVWTANPHPVFGAGSGFFAGGYYFQTSSSNYTYTVDGVVFSATLAFPASGGSEHGAYGNGVYVTVGIDAAHYSATGISGWASATVSWSAGFGPRRVAYGNGIFVAVLLNAGPSQTYYTSTDGQSWTTRSLPSGVSASDVVFAQGRFVVGGTTNEFLGISSDGINWLKTSGVHTFTTSAGFARLTGSDDGVYLAIRQSATTLANVGSC
jgi:hypothetical protein